ncbi:putative alpha,alpha-trehalose-phosphate synthase [UDP-forming] 7 [Dendrobium catenatum]|uniref:Putative alpha,alpha-trehalose-phosphate synthase [UDP-forming] 7 n=1 Tax=Dendrobium catenatum TaxID=906689 RepID=A0A2I0X6F4_9ASPA|nr:putative alpha,alpha-trehalose-phosphate synthase [UDP-forming] 7 [Dendrobium catenatum]
MENLWFKKGFRRIRFYIENDKLNSIDEINESPPTNAPETLSSEKHDETLDSSCDSNGSAAFCPAAMSISRGVIMGLPRPTSLNASELDDYAEKAYLGFKDGNHRILNHDGTMRCAFCAGKKQDYQFKDLLQHAIGRGSSTSRKAKEKANHLGFARFLQKDLALAAGLVVSPPPPPIAETPSSNSSSSTNELFVWPWVGMLVNLPMEDEGVLPKEQFSEFNPVNVISSHERDLEYGKFEVMNEAISMNDVEKQVLHEKHYSYASTHDAAYWSKSFMLDLERTCKDHFKKRCWEIGLGFGFRVVALDSNFRKLNIDGIVSAYRRSKSRAVLLDYDGTVIPQAAINNTPSAEVISILNTLCGDKKNVVFIVSGRGADPSSKEFLELFGHGHRITDVDSSSPLWSDVTWYQSRQDSGVADEAGRAFEFSDLEEEAVSWRVLCFSFCILNGFFRIERRSLQTDDNNEGISDDHISSTPPSVEFSLEEIEDQLSKSSSLPVYDEPMISGGDPSSKEFLELSGHGHHITDMDSSSPLQSGVTYRFLTPSMTFD